MTEPETVLLVDDNAKLRALIRVSVETLGGMRVIGEAGDGAEGIARARALRPDIVLLDLSMPVLDGLESLARIREASPTSHVVIFTGFKADRLALVARELGATAFLEKGLPPSILAEAIRAATASPPPPFHALDETRRDEILARAKELV